MQTSVTSRVRDLVCSFVGAKDSKRCDELTAYSMRVLGSRMQPSMRVGDEDALLRDLKRQLVRGDSETGVASAVRLEALHRRLRKNEGFTVRYRIARTLRGLWC